MTYQRRDDRDDGRKADPCHQRGDDCNRHAKSRKSLKETGKTPREYHQLYDSILRNSHECIADDPNAPGLTDDLEQKKCSPDDVEDPERKKNCFCLRVRNEFGTRPETEIGRNHGDQPGHSACLRPTPVESDHENK
jgi:hypothetical protein